MWLIQRRIFLKRSAAIAMSALAAFFSTRTGHAAWKADHFAGGQFSDTLSRLFNTQAIPNDESISLSLPEVAENGEVVPITISSELEDIDRIFILVEKNPTPLAAEIELFSAATVYVTARVKMAESSNVWVIARRGGKLLKTQQWVNVVHGGCGTG
ncbi:MAG: thiosulfate oxidation carrier protein SoxY [Methylomonas sp.]